MMAWGKPRVSKRGGQPGPSLKENRYRFCLLGTMHRDGARARRHNARGGLAQGDGAGPAAGAYGGSAGTGSCGGGGGVEVSPFEWGNQPRGSPDTLGAVAPVVLAICA